MAFDQDVLKNVEKTITLPENEPFSEQEYSQKSAEYVEVTGQEQEAFSQGTEQEKEQAELARAAEIALPAEQLEIVHEVEVPEEKDEQLLEIEKILSKEKSIKRIYQDLKEQGKEVDFKVRGEKTAHILRAMMNDKKPHPFDVYQEVLKWLQGTSGVGVEYARQEAKRIKDQLMIFMKEQAESQDL